MTKTTHIVSATIVAFLLGSLAVAAPLDTLPDPTPGREETSPRTTDENMAISHPDPSKPQAQLPPKTDYYSFHQALTFRMGAAAPASDTNDSESFLGFSYMFPKFLSPRFEAGADVHNKDDKGHVHAGIRKIFFERGRMRPSLKYGLSHEVHSDEGLATFANNKHYFGRGSAALDWSYDQEWAARLEIEALVGIQKQWFAESLGIVRNW